MARHMSYVDCCTDPNIFGPWFSGDSWNTWRVVDKAVFGLPMTADEMDIFTSLTGLSEATTQPCKEAWLIFGRRGGKDVKAASYATYLATIGAEAYEWRSKLTRGERGVVQLLALDRKQARVALDYMSDKFGGEWVAERFRQCNVNYEASADPKSSLYTDLLPMINSRGVALLENDRMLRQLVGLERRTSRVGKDSIDHAPGVHDDVANAVAGALALSSRGPYFSAEMRAEQTRKIEAAMSRFSRSFV